MDIAITGASGFIGTALGRSLEADGHRVLRLTRSGPSDERKGTVAWDLDAGTIDAQALEGVHAVVHLAGEGIASGRWTEEHKARVRDSRTKGTALLAEAIAGLEAKPKVLISGSAIGYYGNRGDEELDESSQPGDDFLADLCVAWEAATAPAEAAGITVAHIRTGIVLSPEGGMLAKTLLPYKLGLGGKAGDGRQWMSWIALSDVVGGIRHLIDHEIGGAANLTAPNPVRNAEFNKAMGRALHRPTVVPIPRFVSKLPLGIGPLADSLLFSGAKVHPRTLEGSGYQFIHPTIDDALDALVGRRHEQAR